MCTGGGTASICQHRKRGKCGVEGAERTVVGDVNTRMVRGSWDKSEKERLGTDTLGKKGFTRWRGGGEDNN